MAAPNNLITIGDAPRDIEQHRVTQLPVLVLHAHSSCNCRCVMCDIWKTKDSHAFQSADLQPQLESIRQLGVRWVVLSGGEPLLNNEWPQLCSLLRREGIRLTLLTTGLLLARHAAQVAELFDDIIVSLDGPEQIHDAIRRVDKAFALLQRGVDAVRKQRSSLKITARATIQKANHAHLRETLAAAKQLNLNGVSFLAADLTSEAFNRPLGWSTNRQSEVALTVEEVAILETEIACLITENREDLDSGYIAESPEKLRRIARHFRAHLGLDRSQSPRCNAPWTSAVMETDGTVRPCFFHPPIGNIHHSSLEEVINGWEALTFRSRLDIPTNSICQRCVCSLNYRS
jgi:MoaA/NifB/PqqE/SkfB family radical SAM enzyme